MTDVFSPQKRSQIMRKIGPKDSSQERYVRSLVHSMGYRFRLHRKDLPGCPDLAFPKYRKVVFINGCFWHGHKNCKRAQLPQTNRLFWDRKINGNVERDQKNYKKLQMNGWQYLVIWQCEIKKANEFLLSGKIKEFLRS